MLGAARRRPPPTCSMTEEPEPPHLPPYWDQDGVHDDLPRLARRPRRLRRPGPHPLRRGLGRAAGARWCSTPAPTRCTRPSTSTSSARPWIAEDLRAVIERSLVAADSVGAPSTWVLSNHDVVRHASRLGLRRRGPGDPTASAPTDPQPDRVLGLRRARAATTLMLALPGGAYLYQGEELGLPDSTDMPDEFRQDPTFRRTEGEETGRDGCRVPIPWVKDAPEPRLRPVPTRRGSPSRRVYARLRGRPAGGRRRGRPSSSTAPCSPRVASSALGTGVADLRRGVRRLTSSHSPTAAPPGPRPRRREPRLRRPWPCPRGPRYRGLGPPWSTARADRHDGLGPLAPDELR